MVGFAGAAAGTPQRLDGALIGMHPSILYQTHSRDASAPFKFGMFRKLNKAVGPSVKERAADTSYAEPMSLSTGHPDGQALVEDDIGRGPGRDQDQSSALIKPAPAAAGDDDGTPHEAGAAEAGAASPIQPAAVDVVATAAAEVAKGDAEAAVGEAEVAVKAEADAEPTRPAEPASVGAEPEHASVGVESAAQAEAQAEGDEGSNAPAAAVADKAPLAPAEGDEVGASAAPVAPPPGAAAAEPPPPPPKARAAARAAAGSGQLALGALLALLFCAFYAWHCQATHGSIDWHPAWGEGSVVAWGGGGVALGGGAPRWPPAPGARLALPLVWRGGALTRAETEGYLAALGRLPVPRGGARVRAHAMRAWADADDGRAVYMLNLLRELPAPRPAPAGAPAFNGSAKDAAAAYNPGLGALWLSCAAYPVFWGGAQSAAPLLSAGGAAPAAALLGGGGAAAREWSQFVVVRYPNRRTFFKLVTDPRYMALAHLKQMAYDVELRPMSGGWVGPEMTWVAAAALAAAWLAVGWRRAAARARAAA
ncbi:MAG: hypothetical protein J3K34DRAFT_482462 [Monoraphidium minutum]|nr:MAG: hypothetical protein J3K34DRAFT_482462 [Monoraphidium minutum]